MPLIFFFIFSRQLFAAADSHAIAVVTLIDADIAAD